MRQILPSLKWFQASFSSGGSKIERFFSLEAYLRIGSTVELGTGASPWGLGGWLAVDGQVTHYFACPVSKEDVGVFEVPIGSSDGQQLWEAFAILLAVDIWTKVWSQS